jgi:hypothetical protein
VARQARHARQAGVAGVVRVARVERFAIIAIFLRVAWKVRGGAYHNIHVIQLFG